MMLGNNNFVDDEDRELMLKLLKVLEPGHIRNGATENPTDSACAANFQLGELDIRMYLENKINETRAMSRAELEELATRCMCILSSQNVVANALVRKVNERTQQLAVLKQNYKDLEIQIDSIEQNILCTIATIQNADNIQVEIDQNRCTMAAQVSRDDEPPSPDEATSADSEPVPIAEDTALTVEKVRKFSNAPSSPKESSQSDVQQLLGLPTVPANKPMAPAPQIKIHLLNDQVALTWTMLEEDLSAYEPMHTYQVYCYMGSSAPPPSPASWWKLLELTADPLPMTCVVDRCSVGKYYFAVRGIDVQCRVGPFSAPIPVIFDICTIKSIVPN